uniref:(northern house mosquito) hypothetical protein n=1 Tax=Culex pipiens TaxID=7175 RepID=A0A8D8AJU3_CULPI
MMPSAAASLKPDSENPPACRKPGELFASGKSSFEAMATNPSKIQSILQLSVAALAFLAFAGYLLCMIVQAIKSKGITYFHQAVSPVAISAASKKKRPIRNKRHLGLDNEEKHGNNCFRIVYFPIIRASEYIVQKFLLADNLTH